jgi:hypothetical protein
MREHFGARRVKRRALVFGAPKAHWVLGFKILQKPKGTEYQRRITFHPAINPDSPDKQKCGSDLLRLAG